MRRGNSDSSRDDSKIEAKLFKVHTKFWIPHAEKLLNQIKHGCVSRVCILSKEFTYSWWNLEASSSLAWVNVTQSIEYCIIQTIGSVYGALCMAWILYYPNYWQCVWCYFVWLPQFLMYGFHSQLKYPRCTHGASIDRYTLSELECTVSVVLSELRFGAKPEQYQHHQAVVHVILCYIAVKLYTMDWIYYTGLIVNHIRRMCK